MSDTEKMNEAMYERLGEIVFKAANTRTICNGGSGADEKNLQLLAAFTDLRQMCEFYKPEEKVRVGSSSSRKDGSTPLSHSHSDLELPTGCPSLMPRQLPGSFDGVESIREDSPNSPDSRSEAEAEKTADWFRKHYSFCDGLFPIRFTNTEDGQMASCWIGGRHFTLDLDNNERDDGGHDCAAVIRDNGKVVATIETQRGKAISGRIAYGAFKEYVRNLGGNGNYSSRGGFLKAAIKRKAAAKQQAHDNKAAAATHS